MMDKDPRKVMILGGSCSPVTDYIAKTSKHLRIPVVRSKPLVASQLSCNYDWAFLNAFFFCCFFSSNMDRFHGTQLSYADTHPMFTRKSDPNFFRIVPSENAFNAPRVKLLQSFNWTRVGTLYQNEPRFALVSSTASNILSLWSTHYDHSTRHVSAAIHSTRHVSAAISIHLNSIDAT